MDGWIVDFADEYIHFAADAAEHMQALIDDMLSCARVGQDRAMEETEIHIDVSRQESEGVFAARDNGIGIDPRFRDKVFMIFERLHTRDKYPGTGVGLAICKKIVERHGGSIWVDSGQDRGAAFTFTLPAKV